MTMISATNEGWLHDPRAAISKGSSSRPMTASAGVGRPGLFARVVGAAVLCATMATTAAFDSADARGSGEHSYHGGHGHRAGAYDRGRFHHVGGHYYGNIYRGKYGTFYNGAHGLVVRSGRGVHGGGHYFEGY
jgi:hypothetical protein